MQGVYVLTDEFLTPPSTCLVQIEEALKGGATLIQLRHKSASDDELFPLAQQLNALCRDYNALFCVNDRIELAKKVAAHGVHLGKYDTPYDKARAFLGNKTIIGISCYGDMSRAHTYAKRGVDYVAFGSFFRSSTKPQAPVVPLDIITQAKKELSIPVCAIGGIDETNASLLIQQNVDMISLISAVWKSSSPKISVQHFTSLMKGSHG